MNSLYLLPATYQFSLLPGDVVVVQSETDRTHGAVEISGEEHQSRLMSPPSEVQLAFLGLGNRPAVVKVPVQAANLPTLLTNVLKQQQITPQEVTVIVGGSRIVQGTAVDQLAPCSVIVLNPRQVVQASLPELPPIYPIQVANSGTSPTLVRRQQTGNAPQRTMMQTAASELEPVAAAPVRSAESAKPQRASQPAEGPLLAPTVSDDQIAPVAASSRPGSSAPLYDPTAPASSGAVAMSDRPAAAAATFASPAIEIETPGPALPGQVGPQMIRVAEAPTGIVGDSPRYAESQLSGNGQFNGNEQFSGNGQFNGNGPMYSDLGPSKPVPVPFSVEERLTEMPRSPYDPNQLTMRQRIITLEAPPLEMSRTADASGSMPIGPPGPPRMTSHILEVPSETLYRRPPRHAVAPPVPQPRNAATADSVAPPADSPQGNKSQSSTISTNSLVIAMAVGTAIGGMSFILIRRIRHYPAMQAIGEKTRALFSSSAPQQNEGGNDRDSDASSADDAHTVPFTSNAAPVEAPKKPPAVLTPKTSLTVPGTHGTRQAKIARTSALSASDLLADLVADRLPLREEALPLAPVLRVHGRSSALQKLRLDAAEERIPAPHIPLQSFAVPESIARKGTEQFAAADGDAISSADVAQVPTQAVSHTQAGSHTQAADPVTTGQPGQAYSLPEQEQETHSDADGSRFRVDAGESGVPGRRRSSAFERALLASERVGQHQASAARTES